MTHVEQLNNGLSVSVDWLSWTVTEVQVLSSVLSQFGFDSADFYECEKGASGYRRMLVYHGANIRVLFEGNANMGIHFDVSGSAVGELLDVFREVVAEPTPWGTTATDLDTSVLQSLFSLISSIGHLTRLDLAIDNTHDIYYSMMDFTDQLSLGNFTSKFRTWREVLEHTTSGVRTGHTVYMGSGASSIMLRVYDKRLEYNSKHDDKIDYDWVRWELELKDERADLAAVHVVSGISVAEVATGVLSNYLRLIVKDDSNKSRCSTQIDWKAFLCHADKLQLYIKREPDSLQDKEDWILRQVAPTLTALIISKYGDISFLTDHLATHAGRMKKHLCELVDEVYPDWRKALKRYDGV